MLFKGKNRCSLKKKKRELIHWLCVAVGRNSLWSTHTGVSSAFTWERRDVKVITPCPSSLGSMTEGQPVGLVLFCAHPVVVPFIYSENYSQRPLVRMVCEEQSSDHSTWQGIKPMRYSKSDLEVLISEKFPVLICSGFLPLGESSFCLCTEPGLQP